MSFLSNKESDEPSNLCRITSLIAWFLVLIILSVGVIDVYESATYFYSQEYWGRALRLNAWLDGWRAWGVPIPFIRPTHFNIEVLDAVILTTLVLLPLLRAYLVFKLITLTAAALDAHLSDDINRSPVEALPIYAKALSKLYRVRWLFLKRLFALSVVYLGAATLFAVLLFVVVRLSGLSPFYALALTACATAIMTFALPVVLPLLFGDRLPPYPSFDTLNPALSELDPEYIDPVDGHAVGLDTESLPGVWSNGLFVDGAAGLFTRYAQDGAERRRSTEDLYRQSLRMLHPKHKPEPIEIDVGRLGDEGRRLYLPVVIGASSAKDTFDMLDLDRSDFQADRLVYLSQQKGIDLAHWKDQLPTIERYLGGRWSVASGDAATITLARVPTVPPSFPLDPAWVTPGQIFLGRNLATGLPVHLPLDKMTHTLVAGPNGVGKSVFLNQVMASLIANIGHIERMYLVDLKFGMELRRYAGKHHNIQVVDKYENVVSVVAELISLLEERGREAAERGLTLTDRKPIFFIVDEFAQINGYPAEKKAKEALMTDIAKLSMLGRAIGIRLWFQVQRATTDAIPGNIKHNLVTKVAFRHPSNTDAARDIFGITEGLPMDITTLRQGQFIFRDGGTSDTYPIQSALIASGDIERLASPADQNDGHANDNAV